MACAERFTSTRGKSFRLIDPTTIARRSTASAVGVPLREGFGPITSRYISGFQGFGVIADGRSSSEDCMTHEV
jgi:hypothetical protein